MGLLTLDLPETDGLTDRQLLDRYVGKRDESAFALVVERHGGLVRRVARGILADEHAVDEVAQDVFLVLSRKAALIPWQESVGSWLAAAAYRLAHKRRCAAARRRDREQASLVEAGPAGDPLARLEARELQGAVDDELNNLPARYRAPLVLCYLEGRTNRQAADELGWPAGSIARRLARGREILQRRLVLRGFVVAGVVCLLAGLLYSLAPSRESSDDVRPLMALFKDADFESRLARLADGQEAGDADMLTLARQTAGLAEELSRRVPGWAGQAGLMRDSALELAAAIEVSDLQATTRAATKLRSTCVQCHQQVQADRLDGGTALQSRPDRSMVLTFHANTRSPDRQRATGSSLRSLALPARQLPLLAVTVRDCVAAFPPIGETEASGTVELARVSHPGERRSRPPGLPASTMT
jgi:RNA polymerase sigma-70 factor (ECF subfamily)